MNRIENIRKIGDRVFLDIKNNITGVEDVHTSTIVLSNRIKNKFKLYLGSVSTSVRNYSGEKNDTETAYIAPRTLSIHKGEPSKLHITIIGYKDQDYIKIHFFFDSLTIVEEVYLDLKEVNNLLSALNI